MLIFSNFSFATQLMFCEMASDNIKCECSHNEKDKFPGVSFTQEKSNCCDEKTTELTNSNILLNQNISQEFDSYVYLVLFCISTVDLDIINYSLVTYMSRNTYYPDIDIPIFTSSLLI